VLQVVEAAELDDALAVGGDVGVDDVAQPAHLVLELLPREAARKVLQYGAVLGAAATAAAAAEAAAAAAAAAAGGPTLGSALRSDEQERVSCIER
jgi:hypothetical protein